MNTEPQLIACNLNALDAAQRDRRSELAARLRTRVREIVPISDGYTFHLDDKENLLIEIAEFIGLERRCCPFFSFQIDLNPNSDSIWIRLSGGEGVKEFLAAEFDIQQTD
jgi:hypothetical protein